MLKRRHLFVYLPLVILGGCAPPTARPPQPTADVVSKPVRPAESPIEEHARLVAALRMDPDNPEPAVALALFDVSHGHEDDGERELLALCRRYPELAEAPLQLGKIYLAQGKND